MAGWRHSTTHGCILSNLMSLLRKVQMDCVYMQWMEPLQRLRLLSVTFICVPGAGGNKGDERTDWQAKSGGK